MNYFFYLYPLKMNTQRIISSIVTNCKIAVDDGNGGISYYRPDTCAKQNRSIVSVIDYYPDVHTERSRSGMTMDGWSFSSPDYRYGFNGILE